MGYKVLEKMISIIFLMKYVKKISDKKLQKIYGKGTIRVTGFVWVTQFHN